MTPASFAELFGLRHAVVSAPMAKISGGRLAAAVTEAGGLGLIGGGYGDRAWMRREWEIAANPRVGVGLILWVIPDAVEVVDELMNWGVRTFCFAFGDPAAVIDRVRARGGRSLVQINTPQEARSALAAGADAVIAQGEEAGGHGQSGRPLRDLLPAVVELAGRMPVLAAGGITTRSDVAAAVARGASGVLVGTRFYATDEALDLPAAKRRLVEAGSDATTRTSAFDHLRGPLWPEGYNGRALHNSATEWWAGSQASEAEVAQRQDRYRSADLSGDLDFRVVWAGAGVSRIGRIQSASAVTADLAAGLNGANCES
ncbi:MAG: nitronate monooxygenase [Nocardioides sp.]